MVDVYAEDYYYLVDLRAKWNALCEAAWRFVGLEFRDLSSLP